MSIISISRRYLLECSDRAKKEKGCVEEGVVVATHCLGKNLDPLEEIEGVFMKNAQHLPDLPQSRCSVNVTFIFPFLLLHINIVF